MGQGKRRFHEASRPVPPMDPLGRPSADWDTKLVYFGDSLEAECCSPDLVSGSVSMISVGRRRKSARQVSCQARQFPFYTIGIRAVSTMEVDGGLEARIRISTPWKACKVEAIGTALPYSIRRLSRVYLLQCIHCLLLLSIYFYHEGVYSTYSLAGR
jgi:hypothetical protein